MKPQRIKQRVAKTVHITIAMIAGVLSFPVFHWIGWDWTSGPISILVGVYCVAILFSKTPVPGSRAAKIWEDMVEYDAWCRAMGKQPSEQEFVTDSWKTDKTIWVRKSARTGKPIEPSWEAADEDMRSYEAWCKIMGKQPSREEYLRGPPDGPPELSSK